VNKEVKKKWVDALRSGEYAQGRSSLRDHDEYCCLGVLCELAVKEGVIAPPTYSDGVWRYVGDQEYYLPRVVMDWAELTEEDPKVDPGEDSEFSEWNTLAQMNDGAQADFDQIAEMIEECL
jgi:hypothetical protein